MSKYSITTQKTDNLDIKVISVKHKEIEVTFMNYGATILDIKTKDYKGNMESVLLGYKDMETYIDNGMFLNAAVGPTSGRIQNGEYEVNGLKHHLDTGKFPFNLHGGKEAISFKVFDVEVEENDNKTSVIFSIKKPSLNSDYPGNIDIKIIYEVYDSTLEVTYLAKTDQDTILNLTQHAYFNLSGDLKSNCHNHTIRIDASKHLELVDLIPTSIESVDNTNLDFRTPISLSDFLTKDEVGIDNPFLLDNPSLNKSVASLYDPVSNRMMDIYTTYPSIVCYSHNHPDFKELKHNVEHKKHMGICFETQLPPNSMHIDSLSNQILRTDEEYKHKTIFEFKVKKL